MTEGYTHDRCEAILCSSWDFYTCCSDVLDGGVKVTEVSSNGPLIYCNLVNMNINHSSIHLGHSKYYFWKKKKNTIAFQNLGSVIFGCCCCFIYIFLLNFSPEKCTMVSTKILSSKKHLKQFNAFRLADNLLKFKVSIVMGKKDYLNGYWLPYSPDQSNRTPLECGGWTGYSLHGCATNKSAAAVWFCHVNVKISEECSPHLTESLCHEELSYEAKKGPTWY